MTTSTDIPAEIDQLREEVRRLREAGRVHASLLENAPLLISTKDLHGNILMANRHFEVLDGYDAASFVGSNVFDAFPPEIAASLWRNDQRAATEQRAIHEEESVYHRDKTLHVYATVKFPLYDDTGQVCGTCAVSTDITDARTAQIDSVTDELTGLKNRRYFNMRFDEEQRRAHRDRRTLTLMLADVDRFKEYNDTYGHPQGDTVLMRVARTLSGTLNRPGDLVFRIGGDEFACLFATSAEQESVDLAGRIRDQMDAVPIAHKGNLPFGHVTLSMGLAFLHPSHELPLAAAYELADQPLYRAKHQGRNRVSR